MPTTSVGLMGLPHFRTSRISMDMMEPLYMNLYTVDIQLPAKLTTSVDDKNLLLEEVRKVSGLETNKVPGVVTQTYKFAERSYANAGPENTFIDVTIDFQVNLRGSGTGAPDMFALKILRAWDDLVYDPLTGRMGLKVDYVAPTVTITLHNKAQEPYWQWILYNVFPTKSIGGPNLDYTNKSAIFEVTGYTLRCDYWDEVML